MSKESVIKSLYSLQQVVEKTGIGYEILLAAVKSGKLKAFQPGGRKYLVYKKDLNAYLAEVNPKPVQPKLFVEPDNSRNIEIRNKAADLMIQGNKLFEQAYNLLKEID